MTTEDFVTLVSTVVSRFHGLPDPTDEQIKEACDVAYLFRSGNHGEDWLSDEWSRIIGADLAVISNAVGCIDMVVASHLGVELRCRKEYDPDDDVAVLELHCGPSKVIWAEPGPSLVAKIGESARIDDAIRRIFGLTKDDDPISAFVL
jgi:hypothetical protein